MGKVNVSFSLSSSFLTTTDPSTQFSFSPLVFWWEVLERLELTREWVSWPNCSFSLCLVPTRLIVPSWELHWRALTGGVG